MAGATRESIDRMAVQAVKNVLSVFDGAPAFSYCAGRARLMLTINA